MTEWLEDELKASMAYQDTIADIARHSPKQLRDSLIKACSEVHHTSIDKVEKDVEIERRKISARRISWNAQIPNFVYEDHKDEIE